MFKISEKQDELETIVYRIQNIKEIVLDQNYVRKDSMVYTTIGDKKYSYLLPIDSINHLFDNLRLDPKYYGNSVLNDKYYGSRYELTGIKSFSTTEYILTFYHHLSNSYPEFKFIIEDKRLEKYRL